MRLFCLTTCVLLWSITTPNVHGGVQMMLLKALQQVKTVPIILSVSRSSPRRHRASASDVVDVKSPPSEHESVAEFAPDSHEPAKPLKRKVTKKTKPHPKVKYVYVKGGFPKKYLKRSFLNHADYFGGPVKEEVLYEDEDHQFIRVSASRPQPRYTQVRVIHVSSGNHQGCPYLASQTHKPPHSIAESTVGKNEATSHINSVETKKPLHVKHVIHHINYLGHLQDHEHRVPPGSKHEAPVAGNHDRHHHSRPEQPLVPIPPAPHRFNAIVNPHGSSSSAISYHKDTGPSVGRHQIKSQIELHLVNDKIQKQRHAAERHNAFPQYFASSSHRNRPNPATSHHETLPHDFYQPRFPKEPENAHHVEPHQNLNAAEVYGHAHHNSDVNPIHAESAVYADVMKHWPGKEAFVISHVRGHPLLFASAKSPPFKFRHGIRRRSGQNFIDLMLH